MNTILQPKEIKLEMKVYRAKTGKWEDYGVVSHYSHDDELCKNQKRIKLLEKINKKLEEKLEKLNKKGIL